MSLLVKDFMQTPVITALENTNAARLRELMEMNEINAIPIVKVTGEEIAIKGIVTSYDLLGIENEKQVEAEIIMTSLIHPISKQATAKEAAQLMLDRNIHHLIVMDDNEISGMLSSTDFVKIVANN